MRRSRSAQSLEFDLRRALGEDALELHYQPTIRLASEQATGFEALLRWNHPERGPIPPGEFLAIAEDIGLTAEIGGWTLRQACAQAARWPAPIHVAIDVSSLQFLKRNLTESVLQALAQSGLSPHRLELEIAESILHEDPKHALDPAPAAPARRACHAGRLRQRPLLARGLAGIPLRQDQDRQGLRRRHRAKQGGARHRRGNDRARQPDCDMATVAEGIEDFDQLDRLRSWGCRDGQGFLLGPPMPAGEVEGFLRARVPSAQAGARLPTPRAPLSPESGETGEPPASSQAA